MKINIAAITLVLLCLIGVETYAQETKPKSKSPQIEVGSKIPDFTLKDDSGKDFKVSNYIGKKKLVIYFYPKDESSVCTKEACAFRDSYEEFKSTDAMIIGINSGTVKSHADFKKHHNLPFTLLSDPDNTVLKMFGVKDVMFLTGRETFLVDLNGKVVFKFKGMLKGYEHASSVLAFLKKK